MNKLLHALYCKIYAWFLLSIFCFTKKGKSSLDCQIRSYVFLNDPWRLEKPERTSYLATESVCLEKKNSSILVFIMYYRGFQKSVFGISCHILHWFRVAKKWLILFPSRIIQFTYLYNTYNGQSINDLTHFLRFLTPPFPLVIHFTR